MARLSRLPNAVLATWQTGPVPADVFRMRRETGHMIVAAFKLCDFVVLRLAIAGRSLNDGGADVVAMTDSQTYLPRATWIYRRGSSAGDDRRRSHRAREGARTSFAASRQSSQPPSGFNLLVGILDGNFCLEPAGPHPACLQTISICGEAQPWMDPTCPCTFWSARNGGGHRYFRARLPSRRSRNPRERRLRPTIQGSRPEVTLVSRR
jgi:hypothetical protein